MLFAPVRESGIIDGTFETLLPVQKLSAYQGKIGSDRRMAK
jgi:hypothetical protein